MAIFDPNRWCQISVAGSFLAGNNLVGGELLSPEGTGGSVFMYVGNASFTDQQWQIFPYNSTNYVLRTHRSCPFGYLAVTYLATEPMPGYTVVATKNASIADNSMFWSIGPWGDDTPPGDCDHYLNEYNFGSFRLFFERHGDFKLGSHLVTRFHVVIVALLASVGGLALIITAVIAFVLIRRRKKQATSDKETVELPTVPLQPKELPAEQMSSRHLSTEVPAYSAS
ncbi:hypothetical protein DL95DRAFT_454540 [Leptodontidium sp. 2 PMI_412]|nr:hypothetical protein DL95DRAFT_454540 [Leptodontidium sp. 2 PMI_412]